MGFPEQGWVSVQEIVYHHAIRVYHYACAQGFKLKFQKQCQCPHFLCVKSLQLMLHCSF